MSVINCDGCKNNCCERYLVPLTPDEAKMVTDAFPEMEAKMHHFGTVSIMEPPCPFLIEGKCGIYGNRPMICRTYPLDFANAGPGFFYIIAHSECPEHVKVTIDNYIDLLNAKVRSLSFDRRGKEESEKVTLFCNKWEIGHAKKGEDGVLILSSAKVIATVPVQAVMLDIENICKLEGREVTPLAKAILEKGARPPPPPLKGGKKVRNAKSAKPK